MQLIKTEYVYPIRPNKKERKKGKPDKLIMVLKDKDDNKVRKTITEPKITYYITKEKYDDNEYHRYMPRDQVRKVTTPFKDLFKSIEYELDDPAFTAKYRACFDDKRFIAQNLRALHLDRRIHGTDIFIDDYYIGKFLAKYNYEEHSYGISRIGFDIEVDSTSIPGFPREELAECPINAISMKDVDNKNINGYFLKYPECKSFRKAMKNIKAFKKRMKKKYEGYNVNLYFFDDELELIQSFFDYVNDIKPDFATAWNMPFDMTYIRNRLVNLRVNPAEVMCPEDLPKDEKQVRINVDDNPNHDLSEKHSMFLVGGYTVYMDSMELYANITKPMGKEESYSLDYIANKVCGIHKEEVEGNMKYFHLKNYEKFMEYSLQDSHALMSIDEVTNHLQLLHTIGLVTRTTMENAMKKTVSLKNMAKYYATEQNLVQSNNRAKLYDRQEGKIPGGFVGDIVLIDDVGMLINGLNSNRIFELVADMDLSSEYPSLIRALNMFHDTLLGFINTNVNGFDGVQFLQDYISRDFVNLGNRYFNLPAFEKAEELILEKLGVA